MRRHLKTLGLTAALGVTLAANPALANHGHDRGYVSGGSFLVDPALAARCGLGAGSIRPHREFASYGARYDARFDERRHRDSGIGGALVGGVVGGLVGNRIAGRGDRVIGSVAGAAVGAIAGAAIDRAGDDRTGRDGGWRGEPGYDDRGYDDRGYDDRGYDDRGYDDRGFISDECDAVLPAGYRLVSVPGGQECRDEVTTTEEWVPEEVTVPSRPTYRAPVRDKRTKLRPVN